METISDRIIQIQKSSRKTQPDFAASIGISDRTLRAWLSNATKPSVEALQQLVSYYKVDANWLLTGEGQIYRDIEKPKPAEPVTDTNVNILSIQSKANVTKQSQDKARMLAQIESLQATIRSLTATNQALTERLLTQNT